MAENTLDGEYLIKFFGKHFNLKLEASHLFNMLSNVFTNAHYEQDLKYADRSSGTLRLYTAVANLLNTRFETATPVTTEQVISFGGCGPALEHFTRTIGDPGDHILIAAPYYKGFDSDLMTTNNVVPIGVDIPLGVLGSAAEVSYLEEKLYQCKKEGKIVKGVILCNPHNPLGRCYTREAVLAYAQFCERHNLHLLSDEIYALSVFPSKDVPLPNRFVSALSFDFSKHEVNPGRVHVVYGMSKDFAANGFRIGVIISQHNPKLLKSITTTATFSKVASPADTLWSALLDNQKELAKYITKNQNDLRVAYDFAVSWLKFHKIPYIPSNAGHFLAIDLRGVLSNVDKYGSMIPITRGMSMYEREAALLVFLLKHKTYIDSGALFHMPEGGWFRFTFTMRRDYFVVGLQRLERALGWMKAPLI